MFTFLKRTEFFSLAERKRNKMKMAEEYFWAIKQVTR